MAQIECRQTRIRRIHARTSVKKDLEDTKAAVSPEAHHFIGQSQDEREHIGLFVNRHAGDPAVKVCLSTLGSVKTVTELQ